jgi:hypothetical protein
VLRPALSVPPPPPPPAAPSGPSLLKPAFKVPEAPSLSGLPPPPPAGGARVGPSAGKASLPPPPAFSSVEANYEETVSDNKEPVGWVVLDFLALAASVALCLLLWNEFFILVDTKGFL